MGKYEKLLLSILCGTKDSNINFSDLCSVLDDLGFTFRIKGDHFIYTKSDIEEIINIQPVGSKAKPYQVKQVRNLILKYGLGDELNV
ncbi:MAG TPA: toxin HicA [Ruminococcaceae bacterium]|nr:toxin HicA [Oscillospiraceae bacterium]